MSPSDFFYYTVSIGVIIGIVFFALIALEIILTLHTLRRAAHNIHDATKAVSVLRYGLKAGILRILLNIIGEPKGGA